MTDILPTEKLDIAWPEDLDVTDADARNDEANGQIRAFADELRAAGKRPWFEVRYPIPPTLDAMESVRLAHERELTFDAVEVDEDGIISTLPPYAVLTGDEAPFVPPAWENPVVIEPEDVPE